MVKASGVGVFDDVLLGVFDLARPDALTVYWDVDAPATLAEVKAAPDHPLRRVLPQIDHVLTYGGGAPVVQAFQALGARDCRPIYNALDPATHHPVQPDPGFSADLASELTAEAKKSWGTVGYAIAAIRLLRRARPFTVTIEHDGKVEKVTTIQASVGNGRHYGGGMTVQEDATVDDGLLDFYSLEVAHWWRLIALLPALRRGTHGKAADVRAFETTELVQIGRAHV